MVAAVTALLWHYTTNALCFLTSALLLNVVLLLVGGKHALSYVLFPFANSLMNFQHHLVMNQRMCGDNQRRFGKAATILREQIHQDKFQLAETFRGYKEDVQVMKTMCEYAQLFAGVNRELIEGDKDKKRRGKRTRRYPISQAFVKATCDLETVLWSLRFLKV